MIRSAQPRRNEKRGHVMVMKGATTKTCGRFHMSGVRLDGLGRTDKSKAKSESNQDKMYALHFHLCGASKRQMSHIVENSVMTHSPGWGFVNHGSSVIFSGNVAYDYTGAGFVAEAGNERGEFLDNLAVGGRGIDEYAFRKIYLSKKERLRKADLAFRGDGFWIGSPFVRVQDNVAIGNHGDGFVWYLIGIDDRHVGADRNKNDLSLSVGAQFLYAEEQRTLGYDRPRRSWIGAPNRFLISDMPLFYPASGNYAASNFIGLRIRYGRSFNQAFLNNFWPGEQKVDASIQGQDKK